MNNTFVPEKSVISYGSSLPDQELISTAFPSESIWLNSGLLLWKCQGCGEARIVSVSSASRSVEARI